jgi:TolA-binding protein
MSEERRAASRHVEDLSVLSRRGALSTTEEQALTDALEASATLATAHQLGLDFDRFASVEPGDDALIANVTARVVSRELPRAGRRLRTRALLLIATLALAGSATALWQRSRRSTPAQSPAAPHPGADAAAGRTVAPAAAAPSSSERELGPENAGHQPAPVLNAPNARHAPSAPTDEPPAHSLDSAEALFREANAARRSGDAASARALYLRLEHDFPASHEAQLAHLSLGNLLLTMGRAAEAEPQFASYLQGRPALAQEALVGRAQSLAALGRGAEEQRVWESLLHDYPTSVYSARANQRLTELAAAVSPPD